MQHSFARDGPTEPNDRGELILASEEAEVSLKRQKELRKVMESGRVGWPR